MKIIGLITLNLTHEMNNMEKKIYSRPTISKTKLDSEINLVMTSTITGPDIFMGTDETNETDGSGISQFMNPLKWFR